MRLVMSSWEIYCTKFTYNKVIKPWSKIQFKILFKIFNKNIWLFLHAKTSKKNPNKFHKHFLILKKLWTPQRDFKELWLKLSVYQLHIRDFPSRSPPANPPATPLSSSLSETEDIVPSWADRPVATALVRRVNYAWRQLAFWLKHHTSPL